MSDVACQIGDRLRDSDGGVWTVKAVLVAPDLTAYLVIERLVPTERSIRADLVGHHSQYRKVEPEA